MLNVLPIVCRGSVFVFVFVCTTLNPFLFYNNLDEEGRVGCFAFIVFWMSCYCKRSMSLLHGAVGWSAVCDCGIFPDHTHLLFGLNTINTRVGLNTIFTRVGLNTNNTSGGLNTIFTRVGLNTIFTRVGLNTNITSGGLNTIFTRVGLNTYMTSGGLNTIFTIFTRVGLNTNITSGGLNTIFTTLLFIILASGNTTAGGTAYGSLYYPTESGSRGGGGSQAGYGGGKVYIKVPAIILIDGDILADGADATGGEHGGGSGGSILIEAGMWYQQQLLIDGDFLTEGASS